MILTRIRARHDAPARVSVRNCLDYENEVDMGQLLQLELLLGVVQEEGYSIVYASQLAGLVAIPEFADYLSSAVLTVSFI